MLFAACGRLGFDATSGADAGLDAALTDGSGLDATAGDAGSGVIVSSSGLMIISAPSSLEPNTLENDDFGILIVERIDERLGASLSANIRGPGRYTDQFETINPNPIASGSRVTSVFLHIDKVGSDDVLVRFDAEVRFSRPILGIMSAEDQLSASAPLLGDTNTSYSIPASLEAIEDSITISDDLRSISLSFAVNLAHDQLRIVWPLSSNFETGRARSQASRHRVESRLCQRPLSRRGGFPRGSCFRARRPQQPRAIWSRQRRGESVRVGR